MNLEVTDVLLYRISFRFWDKVSHRTWHPSLLLQVPASSTQNLPVPSHFEELLLKTHTTIPSFCGLCESKFKYYAVLHASSIGPLPWAQVVWFVLILIFQISHRKVLSLSFPLANSSQISPNKIWFTLFLRRKRKRRRRKRRRKRRWRRRNCGFHFYFLGQIFALLWPVVGITSVILLKTPDLLWSRR